MAGYKLDVPVDLSERTTHKLELTKNIIHLISGATTLLTICIVAPLIATEAKYLGAGLPGPNYTLFVALFTLPTPFLLVYFPWMYEHHNKFKRLGKFCLKNRTNIIFCSFTTFLWATAGIGITVHSNNKSNCDYSDELTKNYGSDYTSAWSTQCNLANVSAGFVWITCILWLVTLAITGINFWKEKSLIQQRLNEHRLNKQQKLEERQNQDEEDATGGYVNQGGRLNYEDQALDDPFTDGNRYQPTSSPFNDQPIMAQQQNYNNNAYSSPPMAEAYHSPPMGFDTPGQYNDQHHGFSPMPTPQHMPQPEPSYYQPPHNNNF